MSSTQIMQILLIPNKWKQFPWRCSCSTVMSLLYVALENCPVCVISSIIIRITHEHVIFHAIINSFSWFKFCENIGKYTLYFTVTVISIPFYCLSLNKLHIWHCPICVWSTEQLVRSLLSLDVGGNQMSWLTRPAYSPVLTL